MITRNHSEFYAKQQRFIFVHPDAEIDPDTNFPVGDRGQDWAIVDVDELVTVGCPMFEDVEFEFWAVLEPGEKI